MSVPSSLMSHVLHPDQMSGWYDLVSRTMTLALVLALGVTLWLMLRLDGPDALDD
jgi:hypothetical protein